MASDEGLTIGVDLGATKLAVALVDAEGAVVASSRRPTHAERDADEVVADVITCVKQDCLSVAASDVLAVGVGVAGQVDPATATVVHAPNLRWDDYPLGSRLSEALSVPAFVLTDVQAATYGEWHHGAGKNVTDLVCLFVGTGVGGGVISNGQLVQGCAGSAGELGHITIDLNGGPSCRCGNHGCLEAFAGGWAIARRAQQVAASDRRAASMMLELAGGDAEAITAGVVSDAYHQGDPLAAEMVQRAGDALAAGAASIANAFNPCRLVLGGGVIEGLPELIDRVKAGISERALEAALRPLLIVKAELGGNSGTVGAAVWARRNL